ncbi:branched-chain alpha-ketoacid dehydrogenase [Gorgonomyces haynaldii]|nr:branched-chain alpha-ketoacid dehydrogenase [Gorgonomyces haynaldii]
MSAHLRQYTKSTFYHNKILDQYASHELKTVSLRQLTVFGRSMNPEKLLRSANHLRQELPVRLAYRIKAFQQLPYIMGTNPHIEKIYHLYWDAFDKLRTIPHIANLKDNDVFCEMVQQMLNEHRIAIPQLSRGIAHAGAHMTPEAADKFMDETLRARIGRRVLAEHHIALTKVINSGLSSDPHIVGVVNTMCKAQDIITKVVRVVSPMFENTFGVPAPNVTVDGFTNAIFTYIPEHIEYLLFEILKNAMRFTAHHHLPLIKPGEPLPPIGITIGMDQNQVVFRISDQAGGIPKSVLDNIWSWTHAAKRNLERLEKVTYLTGKMDEAVSFSAPLGLGLPMSLCYTKYWGGNISLYSMPDFGTDLFVTLSTANHLEQL